MPLEDIDYLFQAPVADERQNGFGSIPIPLLAPYTFPSYGKEQLVYTLDLVTIMQIMQAHKKTGALHADLPSGVPKLREPCRVEIALEAGNIFSCAIISKRGSLLTGDEAYQKLVHLGRIRWTFVPQQSSVQPSESANRASEKAVVSHPYRVGVIEQEQIRSWRLMYKMVYGLADGTRNIEEIAALLSTTPEAIEEVLRDLQSMRVIAME